MHMFKKRRRERTTEDIPDSIAPWEMLHEDEIEQTTHSLRGRYPTLTAFARRMDTGSVACFDKGLDGTSKDIVVINAEHTERRHYPSFTAWFEAALHDAGL
jgi:hypothetical protein